MTDRRSSGLICSSDGVNQANKRKRTSSNNDSNRNQNNEPNPTLSSSSGASFDASRSSAGLEDTAAFSEREGSYALAQLEGENLRGNSSDTRQENAGEDQGQVKKIRRVTKACKLCRKHKLRCSGDSPCARCRKGGHECVFEPTEFGFRHDSFLLQQAMQSTSGLEIGGDESRRISLLENNLGDMTRQLAEMKELLGSRLGISNTLNTGSSLKETERVYRGQEDRSTDFWTENAVASSSRNTVGRVKNIRMTADATDTGMDTSFDFPPESSGQIATLPFDPFASTSTQPLPSSSNFPVVQSPADSHHPSASGHSEHSGLTHRIRTRSPPQPGPSAERRLKDYVEADPRFCPPFKAVMFNPSVWDNKEQSRRASPEPIQTIETPGTGSRTNASTLKDDPIDLGILSEAEGRQLFLSFSTHNHQFMPIVNLESSSDPYRFYKDHSSFLFCVILAIAGRYHGPADRFNSMTALAEQHLAGTLLTKGHVLMDVQATMLLAGWGLHANGGGSDAWMLTGHAFRMARRLGLHKDDEVYLSDRLAFAGAKNEVKLNKFFNRRRTWLALVAFDCLLSLGFGRPPSAIEYEANNTASFLSLCTSRPSGAAADYYVACQGDLMSIARLFQVRMEQLKSPGMGPPRENELLQYCSELNIKIDQFARQWTRQDALYAPYLGGLLRNARLCCEHITLCVNSVALRPSSRRQSISPAPISSPVVGFETSHSIMASSGLSITLSRDLLDGVTGPASTRPGSTSNLEQQCLNKAIEAAVGIVSIHHDSADQDMAMSFATDYLCITLAHAALFLIRLSQGKDRSLWNSIATHLQQAVDVAEKAERSATGLNTNLSRLIRDVSRAAGFLEIAASSVGPNPASQDIFGFDFTSFLSSGYDWTGFEANGISSGADEYAALFSGGVGGNEPLWGYSQ